MATVLVTAAEFADALRASQLLDDSQRAEFDQIARQHTSLAPLTGELVRRGWLTTYQANQVARGKIAELVLDQYVILELLGQGGMGAVYKARQRRMDRLVALKVIRSEVLKSPGAVERFQRECQTTAKLSHPHIVTVFDSNTVNGTHFLVMEFLEGIDLSKVIEKKGPLPIAHACHYVRQAALGLKHAHEKGLIHRDIKPHNLMLTRTGIVKVMDLGLARATNSAEGGMTGTGVMMGTPDYLAPEQTKDAKSVDIRADIYSLGCTLYHLLTGRIPFGGTTIAEKLTGHLFMEPPAIETIRTDVPPAVAEIVRKMMAKEPAQRFQVPDEVARALAPFARGGAPAPSGAQPAGPSPAAALAAETVLPPTTAPGGVPPASLGARTGAPMQRNTGLLGAQTIAPSAPASSASTIVPRAPGGQTTLRENKRQPPPSSKKWLVMASLLGMVLLVCGAVGGAVLFPDLLKKETAKPEVAVLPSQAEAPAGPTDTRPAEPRTTQAASTEPRKDPEEKDPEKKDPEKKDPEKKDPEKKDPEKKDPDKAPEPKSPRKKLLADLEDRGKEEIAAFDAEVKRCETDKELTDKEYDLFRQSPRFGDLFDEAVVKETNDFQRRYAELAKRWSKLRAKLDVLAYNLEQERRKIRLRYPEPGDPEVVEYKGLVLTREEVGASKQFEKEHGTAKQAADTYMNTLLKEGTIKKSVSAAVAVDSSDVKTAAVVYLVTANIQGRSVYKYPSHVFVYRREDGFWFVSGGFKLEQGLVIGPPPTGFKPMEDAPATDVMIPFVALYLKSTDVAGRVKAAQELAKMDVDAREVSLYLCEAILDPTPAMQRAVNAALEKVNPTLKKPVNTILTNQTIQARIDAANQIGKMGDDGYPAIPVLIRALRTDRAGLVRAAAAEVLGQVGAANEEVKEVLKKAEASDPSANVRKAATKALEKLEG